jgi:predicted AlkP superfamily pyrophosphatase or phosphodiesterase
MKLKFLLFLCYVISTQCTYAQLQKTKPKLVIGLVIDQMRWDFLYRYENRYSKEGFKRLLNDGFSCENTFIPYAPTVTAAGHSSIFSGSVPAINGIMGNAWYDKKIKRTVYCCEDTTVNSVGGDSKNGKMSPVNMLTTTIGDELKLSNNLKSKVFGVCIKDRGAIFPSGHTANGAYWYDGKTGNWITSSYYVSQLPSWLIEFNRQKNANTYFEKDWTTLYPIGTYTQSTTDEKPYEGKFKGEQTTSFPHLLKQFIDKDFDMLPSTPYGNTFTLDMAKKIIENNNLGSTAVTDLLTVSLSSPDYIGHRYGPNSIEVEDAYLRLDIDIANFLKYLDTKIGKGNYTLFLSADHGVAHVPSFLKENKIPAGTWDNNNLVKDLNLYIKEKFNVDKIILAESNYQLYINDDPIVGNTISKQIIIDEVIKYCSKINGVAQVFELKNIASTSIPEPIKTMLINGHHQKRAGDIQIILEPAWIDGNNIGTTHGLWNPYDSHIPLLWFGNGIKKGKTNRTTYMTDIAPTLAALLQIQMPNGCIGTVINEVLMR